MVVYHHGGISLNVETFHFYANTQTIPWLIHSTYYYIDANANAKPMSGTH